MYATLATPNMGVACATWVAGGRCSLSARARRMFFLLFSGQDSLPLPLPARSRATKALLQFCFHCIAKWQAFLFRKSHHPHMGDATLTFLVLFAFFSFRP